MMKRNLYQTLPLEVKQNRLTDFYLQKLANKTVTRQDLFKKVKRIKRVTGWNMGHIPNKSNKELVYIIVYFSLTT
jgi:hypothetical protein